MQFKQDDVVPILTSCLLLAVNQLHKANRGQKHQPAQRKPWHSWLSAHTRSQSPLVEEVKWSDLPVHALCAVLAVGGHQLLRIVRKRRQRDTAGGSGGGGNSRSGGGHGHSGTGGSYSSSTHSHRRQGQPAVRSRLQGRSRLNSNHPRFL